MDKSLSERAYTRGQNAGRAEDIKLCLMGKAIFEEDAPYAHNIRRARIDAAVFEGYPIEIDEDEIIIGRFAENAVLTDGQQSLADRTRAYLKASGRLAGTYTAATGHRVIDYEKLLNKGIRAVLAEIDDCCGKIDFSKPEDASRAAFYEAAKISLLGFVRFCARAREALLEKAQSASGARKARLAQMAKNFERAPMERCEHFYEAAQIMWFMQFALHLLGDTTLTGRFDNYMWPFYKRDMDAGLLTREEAFSIIEHIYLKHNEIYDTWPASVMVGGVDRAGKPVWNDLTRMCIEAIRTTGLINPSVNVSYTPDMPEDLFDTALEIIGEGYTRPAFFNDLVIQSGLREAGMTEEDARYYIHSTCVEITPIGASNVQVATPYINLNKCYEYIFNEGNAIFGAQCKVFPEIRFKIEDLKTFTDFYALTKQVVQGIIRANLMDTCKYLLGFSQYQSSPLASCFINDCIARGADSGSGGARYSYVYPCFPGFLNLVDALSAVRKAVYEDKIMTLREMGDLLRGNFEGSARMRQFLINRCPKIGNGIPEADEIAVEMYDLIRHELENYTTSVGASFHPSYFAWIMHGMLGRVAAATPDGRMQGEALSECLGAVQGMDRNGPTGILRSIEKIDQKYGIGGIATNMRFTKKLMSSAEGRDAVKNYIKLFMLHDCFEIQFNIVDQADLLDAKAHPERHQTLMVRVAGYSDYFVNLSDVIQNEIIKRSEHDGV